MLIIRSPQRCDEFGRQEPHEPGEADEVDVMLGKARLDLGFGRHCPGSRSRQQAVAMPAARALSSPAALARLDRTRAISAG